GDRRPGIARISAAPPGAASRQTGGVGMAASPLRIERPITRGFDPRAVRREFPIFTAHPGLVFLDSGASAQKPRSVIDGIAEFYRTDYANVHRGVYHLSARSTDRLVAVTHISNVTGTLLPIERIVQLAHAKGAKVLVDGCQAVPRMPVDVQALGCDFYVFSGHKSYGPTGTGVLYGRYDALESMPPWQTGGGMISSVEYAQTEFLEPPHRFEAGTPDIAGAVGIGLALDFIEGIGREAIAEHEQTLTGYA